MADSLERIPYDWARVECPTCGAPPDTRCKTMSGRGTDAHAKRTREGTQLVRYRNEFDAHGCRCATPGKTGHNPNHGLSAYAITHSAVEPHYPHDPSDLCRCLYVSPTAPTHMRSRSPIWNVLVEHWEELATLLKEEHRDGRALRTCARMKELIDGARRAA